MSIDTQSVGTLFAHAAMNLDTVCYRGSAPINDLARMSQSDIFDQERNSNGTQRDLSPKHASDAYEYIKRSPHPDYPRAFPEVVLNVRDKRVLKLEQIIDQKMVPPLTEAVRDAARQGQLEMYRIEFDIDLMDLTDMVFVSRVDGNHRLEYANGDALRAPLDSAVPFQIHVGLSPDQERSLFVDINSNQKA